MFSLVCVLPSPASAESRPSLFGWFTGTTAQSDFSSTCMSAVRLGAFADRPRSSDQGALEISRFSCMTCWRFMLSLLRSVFNHHCSHQFSWPQRRSEGGHYQICIRCGDQYVYDW